MKSINELIKRYNIKSSSSFRQFILRNLDIINADGVHAMQTKNGWQFDSEAVRIIDELRNFSSVVVINSAESERIKELQTEIDNLKNLLLATQSKLIKTQELLQENQQKLLTAESSKIELEREKILREVSDKRVEELHEQIEKIKSRNIFERLINKTN